jgi:dTDP-4-dehydrorhamnose reductase
MLVCFSHLRWDFVWQRPQHLLSRFAERMPVVVVEEPREEDSNSGLHVERHGNVTVVTPLLGAGSASASSFGAAANAVIRTELQAFLANEPDFAGCSNPVLWYYTPLALGAEPTSLLDKALVVYDAMDELASFRGASVALREREDALLAQADLVFTGGPSLYAARRDRHTNVHCFPSGVDAAHFATATESVAQLPGLDTCPRPIIGFYGVVDERIDLGLVDSIAEARPDWTLAMVGPIAKISLDDLPRRPNIAYFGKQEYQDLPAFLSTFDVGLLPFARNDATRFISPTKTLEYLAGGKPVVSTPITDVVGLYGDVVRFAATPEGITAVIEAMLDECPAARERRLDASRRLVDQFAWDQIAEQMLALVEDASDERHGQSGIGSELRQPESLVELSKAHGPDRSNTLASATSLKVWAGVEGTVNRVGDRYFNQLARNGHDRRISDLDLFAGLGIQAIRYPVLWEQTAPDGLERADWSWSDERLARLRALDLRPIVGLVHHGSGPRDTNLLDPAFPERLAAFAAAVARRYPWVDEWTPVNEPLTTARFSALYGHWYPHARDDRSFARALLTQCRAVVLSMRAIREANPGARLVQTDDLGKTYSTPLLAYQAEMENERRWVTWDLLAGQLTPDRLMWGWLRDVGIPEEDLAWFLENPCPPDVVGVNHYLSSERFLDERVELYPSESPGKNGRHEYVDVLAARVLPEGAAGPETLLMEAWERFGLPLAVTEAHNGCTREEQLRWLDEVWSGAQRAQNAGADVRAVTVWSLLGAYDWHTLVTRHEGVYEPGVFDVRSPTPRPTAIAHMVGDLATKGRHDHPTLAVPGWWRRPDRFIYGPALADDAPGVDWRQGERDQRGARPIVIAGEDGPVVGSLVRTCRERSIPYHVVSRRSALNADPDTVTELLGTLNAWAVLDGCMSGLTESTHCGAAGCIRCREDDQASAAIAAACSHLGIPLLTISSDLVFDGQRRESYVESSPISPVGACNRLVADRERRSLNAHPSAIVVRTGPLFGCEGQSDPLAQALHALIEGKPFMAEDEVRSPTYALDFAHAALDLLLDGERGVWHLANTGSASWFDLVWRAADLAGIDPSGLTPHEPNPIVASEPGRIRVLESERGWLLPKLDKSLARHVQTFMTAHDGIQRVMAA